MATILLDKLATLFHVLPKGRQQAPFMAARWWQLTDFWDSAQRAGHRIVLSGRIVASVLAGLDHDRRALESSFAKYEAARPGASPSPADFLAFLRRPQPGNAPDAGARLASLVLMVLGLSDEEDFGEDPEGYRRLKGLCLAALAEKGINERAKGAEPLDEEEPPICDPRAPPAGGCPTRRLLEGFAQSSWFQDVWARWRMEAEWLDAELHMMYRGWFAMVHGRVLPPHPCVPPGPEARVRQYGACLDAFEADARQSGQSRTCQEWFIQRMDAFRLAVSLVTKLAKACRPNGRPACLCPYDHWVALALAVKPGRPYAVEFTRADDLFAFDPRLRLQTLSEDRMVRVERRRDSRVAYGGDETWLARIRRHESADEWSGRWRIVDQGMRAFHGFGSKGNTIRLDPFLDALCAEWDSDWRQYLATRWVGPAQATGFRHVGDVAADPLWMLITPDPP